MKTGADIAFARKRLADRYANERDQLAPEQRATLAGMLTALCWVMDSPNGSTLDRIVLGEPFGERNPQGGAESG